MPTHTGFTVIQCPEYKPLWRFYDNVTVILSFTCCCSFDEVGVTDATVVLLLTSLLRTVPATCVRLFWDAVRRFANLETLHEGLMLLTWAVYFPLPAVDETAVSTRVFIVMSGMVGLSDPPPPCPRSGGPSVRERLHQGVRLAVSLWPWSPTHQQTGSQEAALCFNCQVLWVRECHDQHMSPWAIVWCGLCDPTFSRFNRTPTCDERTDGHRAMASTTDA